MTENKEEDGEDDSQDEGIDEEEEEEILRKMTKISKSQSIESEFVEDSILMGERASGAVSMKIVSLTIKEMGGYCVVIPILIMSLSIAFLTQYSTYFLQNWAEFFDSTTAIKNLGLYALYTSLRNFFLKCSHWN